METKFTKGPWVATLPEKSNGFWYVDKSELKVKSGEIATSYANNAAANAHLIAAAPEMYDMLQAITEMNGHELVEFIENSDSVISLLAKARGEGL